MTVFLWKPQGVRTPESNTLCRVRSITPLKPRSKRAMCLPKYTAEVQRIHASAQGADWSSLAVWSRVATCLRMLTTQTKRQGTAAEPRGTTAP